VPVWGRVVNLLKTGGVVTGITGAA
jgi:hypothetical protein